MDYSVIIPGYNAEKTLRWCMEGLARQEFSGEWETVVVESVDAGYVPELSADFPRVTFVVAGERLFSGQARNVGARFASGERLVFLDADCRPTPGWLSSLDEGFRRGYEVVSGSIDNGTPGSMVGTCEYLVSHSAYSSTMPGGAVEDSTAASGNLSVSRRVLDSNGGFAGTARANDFLFSRGLHASGVGMLFQPGAAVLHLNCVEVGEFVRGQVNRGYWNAMARIEFGLQGSVARKAPPLAFMVVPLRLYRMVARCLRYRPVPPSRLAAALPLSAIGVCAWAWGYFKAARERGETGLEEREPLPGGWSEYKVVGGASGGHDQGRMDSRL